MLWRGGDTNKTSVEGWNGKSARRISSVNIQAQVPIECSTEVRWSSTSTVGEDGLKYQPNQKKIASL